VKRGSVLPFGPSTGPTRGAAAREVFMHAFTAGRSHASHQAAKPNYEGNDHKNSNE